MSASTLRLGVATRVLYSVGLFSILPATFVVNSGWIGLAMSGASGASVHVTILLLLAAAIVFRIYQ